MVFDETVKLIFGLQTLIFMQGWSLMGVSTPGLFDLRLECVTAELPNFLPSLQTTCLNLKLPGALAKDVKGNHSHVRNVSYYPEHLIQSMCHYQHCALNFMKRF